MRSQLRGHTTQPWFLGGVVGGVLESEAGGTARHRRNTTTLLVVRLHQALVDIF